MNDIYSHFGSDNSSHKIIFMCSPCFAWYFTPGVTSPTIKPTEQPTGIPIANPVPIFAGFGINEKPTPAPAPIAPKPKVEAASFPAVCQAPSFKVPSFVCVFALRFCDWQFGKMILS